MSKVESTERADSPTLWHDIIPSVATLRPRHSDIRVAPGEQPVELTSPETTLDTALSLIPHLRDERSTLRTLFPRLPADIEIIIPSPAAKSETAAPPAPTVVSLGDVADLSPSKAAAASGVPNARLLGALVQSAILHGVPQPTPQSVYARRITGWLHGLAPLEAYLLHQAILGDRVPRALRVQTSGLAGLSRAEQLRTSFGALLAADTELAALFDVIYNELNPLASSTRSFQRVPELSEELLAGEHWGLPRGKRVSLGKLVGALHTELDAADGWLLISKAKKGAPREHWTVESLRETQRSMLRQLLRTGSAAPEELRDQLAKARVPLPHADDIEAWREFCGLEVVDGSMRVLDEPTDDGDVNENRAMVAAAFAKDPGSVLKANAPVLGTSVFPSVAAPDEETGEEIRRAAASPLAAAFGEDTFASLQEISMLTGVDFDSIMAELGHGTEPLAALESLGIPAAALLDELDELLTGPRSAQKAILMLWAVNRARGGGGAPAHFSEAKYELTGAMLRHPATFADPDPAESWRLVLGSSWWHSPRWEKEFPGHTPSTDEVRRFNYIAELGQNVHRAMESAAFRAQADARIAATLAQAPAQDVSAAVIQKTSERTAARLDSDDSAVTPKTLLEWEHMLTARLESATLIVDADLRPDELTTLCAELGARIGDLPADPQTYADFVKRYPAATLSAVVGIASLNAYRGLYIADDPMRDVYHGLVPTIGEALGLFESEDAPGSYGMMQQGLEAEFAQALRDLDLAEFVDLHTHHLADLIVAHAGLPVSAMGTIVDALTAFTTSVPDRTMHDVYQWLLDPSQREFFGTLPSGTQLLFQQAPTLSARMLNQAVDLVEAYPRTDSTHDVGAGDPDDAALSALVDVGSLPTMIREGLLDALRTQAAEAGSAPTRTTASRRAADRMQRPYLWLDGTDAVCVALPPVSKCADEPWIVSTGDDVTPVRPRRSLRDDETQTSLLRKPARRVAVIHPSFHTTVELRLFTTDFPVALFLPDGKQIPTSAMVPQGEVFALVPPGHEPTTDKSGAPQVLETLDTPEGWGQWILQLWNLDGLDKVVVQDAAGVAHEIRVGNHELPALWDTEDEPIEALTGVESEDGLPVLAARPWLDVPPLPAGTRPWTVHIRRSGTAEWHTVGTYAPESEHEGYPLFDDAVLSFFGLSESEPILGGFDIRVDGPEHARVDLRIFLAEGFYAHFPESPRLPGPDGASRAVAELSSESVDGETAEGASEAALSVSADTLEFGPTTRRLRVQVASGSHAETLVIRPPRLRFRMSSKGMAPAWSDQCISRSPFDFEHSTLVVRDPYATLRISLLLVDDNGRTAQRADFDRDMDGTFRIDAGRFAERARLIRRGELRAQVIDPDAEGTRHFKRTVPLVRFDAVTEQNITLDGKNFRVTGAAEVDDVVCRVWQLERPWLPAISIPVNDGFAPMPSSLEGAGRLRVDVAVEDPWDPVPAGPLPHRGTTSLQTASRFSNTGLGLLSQFLAGRGAANFVPHGVPESWNAWALLSQNLHPSTDRPQRLELAAHLRQSPRAELVGLDRSLLPSSQKLAAFISSGLVNEPVGPAEPMGDPWDRAAAGARRSVSIPGRTREAWIDLFISIATVEQLPRESRALVTSHLREVGGDSLFNVLAFGEDPLQDSVRLGLPEVQAAMDPTLRNMLLSRPTIPGPLLDASSRWEGLLSLLRTEQSFNAGYVRDQFERMLGKYESLRRFRPLYRLITERIKALPATVEVDTRRSGTRRSKKGSRARGAQGNSAQAVELPMWANIPQLTFSLALLARGHAYGYFKTGLDQDLLDLWARLVSQAPQQIVIDLVLAEAHIAHIRMGGSTFLP